MCFSATASFTVAAATGLAGVFTLSQAESPRELPLAAIPAVFAAQQAIEGALWLSLGSGAHPGVDSILANAFALVALGAWPLLSPFAALLVERGNIRRAAMAALLVLGAFVAYFGIHETGAHPYNVCITGHTLSYVNGNLYPPAVMAGYVASTTLPMLLSSRKSLRAFGLIAATGLLISSVSYYTAFFSVWCFFAASASVALVLHFSNQTREIQVRSAQ